MFGSKNKRGDLITGVWAKIYDLGFVLTGLSAIHRRVLRLIELAPNQSLLDIGCGTGRVLKALAAKKIDGVSLAGIDPSPDMLDLAAKDSNLKLKIAYGSDLPFGNETFDWVISVLVAHHMPVDEKEKMVDETVRVLKPGGRFLVSDLGRPEGFFSRLLAAVSNHSYAKGNMEVMERKINERGLRLIRRDRSFGYIEYLLYEKPR